MKDLKKIWQFIEEKIPNDKDLTEKIIKKHFRKIPQNVRLLRAYNFCDKKILEIGASKGNSFLHWKDNSEAIELDTNSAEFLRNLGKTVYDTNIEDDFHLILNNKYEAIYTNNLLEHVTSPHLFLLKTHFLLEDDGYLAIGFPLVPLFPFNLIYQLFGFRGWLAREHINFFTINTARLSLERSGFKILDYHVGPLSYFPFANVLKKICSLFGFSCLFICKKDLNFRLTARGLDVYPSNQNTRDLINHHL